MGYQISKTFSWDMGHRITQHGGKCYSPHGHHYTAEVFLSSELNQMGMVLDFYELTQVVNPIIEEMDHAFMMCERDSVLRWFYKNVDLMVHQLGVFKELGELPKDVPEVLQADGAGLLSRPFKRIVVPFESTAENIAKYIFDRVKERLPNVSKVIVWETPKCKAEYTL